MLRYAIVTSQPRGYGGLFLQRLASAGAPAATAAAAVVFCENQRSVAARRRLLLRRARKALRIGIVGTLNGLRMRDWYGEELAARLNAPDVEQAANEARVPVYRIQRFGDSRALDIMQELELDVAVSMGNGYIPASFYQVPRFGMINIHHEWLPEYRGAQTALWQIHDGSTLTGYTIHELSREIDGGRILYRERVPITFCETLRETVVETSARVQRCSLDGLAEVLSNFESYRDQSILNDGRRTFTTPSSLALLRILRNHRRLKSAQAAGPDSDVA